MESTENKSSKIIEIFNAINTFYPIELIKSHIKFNIVSLFFWLMLFAIIFDSLGSTFGLNYLFLSPEYLGEVSAWSFFWVGIALGGFTTAFNTYSYIKTGRRYPFLATVNKPFFMFSLNNSIIPLCFIICYMIKLSIFQKNEELASTFNIITYNISFLVGFIFFILFSFFYFFSRKTDTLEEGEEDEPTVSSVFIKQKKWYSLFKINRNRTFYYISSKFQFYKSRNVKHLDNEVIERIFAMNVVNATIFEILTVITFFTLSFFKDSPLMEFPAAMSIILLLTMLHMIFSFIASWLRQWTFAVIILLFVCMNYISKHSNIFQYTNYAYGLNYENSKKVELSSNNLIAQSQNKHIEKESFNNYIEILENWKKNTGQDKPKLVILNTSGGGSRSALWTFHVLRYCNMKLNGKLNPHIQMITGASGGMLGASYYRSLMLEKKLNHIDNINEYKYLNNLGKDLLNKLSFYASTNDLFVRLQKVHINGHAYTKDRGYAFEEQLHDNTDDIMRKPLGYFAKYEKSAAIPLMIFSPSIINDGRRLLISSQHLNFMTNVSKVPINNIYSYQNIDYQTYFKNNDPQNINFSTVMRMNASFPYFMPMVTMPTNPQMLIMDAGIRDNIGIKTTISLLDKIDEWIQKNTSGVVILEIRDTKHYIFNKQYPTTSFSDKLTLPFSNLYANLFRSQDFDHEQVLTEAINDKKYPIDIVSFCLLRNQDERISLSWHLTKNEKKKIIESIKSTSNQSALLKLADLLN